ncbi:MAG: response regulator [Chlamydiae bacterium]|nr:response regulator [Chlamydiota bacterium]MBI3266803.1 response regulator [Chlamydiota bacterium]
MKAQPVVLIVDDERGPRESLKVILSGEYELLLASDGRQALELVKNHPVDVVVSDLKMPELTGIDVLEGVKAWDPTIEVILLTAYGSHENVDAAIERGVFEFLSKPYDIHRVREAVRKGIEKKRGLSLS